METSTDNDWSIDIVKCLPEDICDNIFGNLEAPDLLKASLVSTEWYKFIAKSAVCMKKLKLKFSPRGLKETRLVILKRNVLNSDRKYENVDFQDMELGDMRNILQTRGRKWKKVTMTSLRCSTDLDFTNFVAFVEPFVEDLKIKHVRTSRDYLPKKRKLSDQQKKSLTFPNLKFLELEHCDASIIELFQDVVTLTEFNTRTSSTASSAIQKIIRCNKGLKKLTTSCIALDQRVRDITYKLVSLQICDLHGLSDDHKTSLKQFLELHMNTLEELYITDWMGLEIVKMIFHMPKLKHLYLGVYHHRAEETVDWKEISFKQSLSLTSLHFGDFKVNIKILRAILIATPNVKKLELFWINGEIIACISNLLPNLESLSVYNFKVLDVTDKSFLPNLKELSMKLYSQGIKVSGAKEDRSKFESLFLAEKKKTDRRVQSVWIQRLGRSQQVRESVPC